MNSMRKVIGSVTRIMFGLVVLAGAFVLLAVGGWESRDTGATLQDRDRVVTKKPWRVEPVKVIAGKTKKHHEVEIGKPFKEDDDWLDGFTITLKNDSDKVVTGLIVGIIFPRPPGDNRNKYEAHLGFGPTPSDPAYVQKKPKRIVRPGETIVIEVKPNKYNRIRETLEKLGYSRSIETAEVVVEEVGFEDGSVLISGTLWIQDPDHPNDRTKKIQADKVKSAEPRHHRLRATTNPKPRDLSPRAMAMSKNHSRFGGLLGSNEGKRQQALENRTLGVGCISHARAIESWSQSSIAQRQASTPLCCT